MLAIGAASAVRHVCEVQIAHITMVNARQGLPGHIIYARVRNATETLEKMGLERGETRTKAVSRRLETLDESGTSRKEALAELMRLGVDEESLLAGGVTDGLLHGGQMRTRQQMATPRARPPSSPRRWPYTRPRCPRWRGSSSTASWDCSSAA